MRLLSYNIWNYQGHWERRRLRLANLIAALDPDIVALQEVRHSWHDRPGENQAEWLARSLGYRAYFRPANVFVPLPPVVEGLAFLAKAPCDQLTWYPVPAFPGAGPRRVVSELGGRPADPRRVGPEQLWALPCRCPGPGAGDHQQADHRLPRRGPAAVSSQTRGGKGKRRELRPAHHR